MASGTGWLQRAWAAVRTGTRAFAVACRCGKVLRGRRGATHQLVRCPACSRSVLVYPASAFQPPTAPRPAQPLSAVWLLVPVAVLGLLAIGVFYALVRNIKGTDPAGPPAASPRSQLLAKLDEGERELEQGGLHLAREKLDEVVRQRDADPKLLTEPEHRRLNQLQRQAALLTDLAPVTVTGLLEQAEAAPGLAAWQARCRTYQGKGVLLDDVLRGDRAPGRVQARKLGDIRVGGTAGRVALEDLTLLQQLPLQMPQRWLVGARLKNVDREGGPGWVIRLEPESGVLFTTRAPVEAEWPALRNDAEWPLLLSRQQALLDTLPAPRAHRP